MTSNAFSKMRGWQTVEIKGADAKDYLHRITSANFMNLKPGAFTPATLLAPTGKIQLYFKAIMLADNHYLLLVPPPPASDSANPGAAEIARCELEKMHFRENLTITAQTDVWVYLRVIASEQTKVDGLAPVTPAPGFARTTSDGRIVLNENRWTTAPIKMDLGLVVPTAKLAQVTQALRYAEYREVDNLEAYRLRAVDPIAPNELNATVIPLEAKLDDAVHENKGCYPGQEVVERIRSLGQVPRCLVSLRGQGTPPAAPQDILTDTTVAGTLTSASADPLESGWIGLGYVRRTLLKDAQKFSVAQNSVIVRAK